MPFQRRALFLSIALSFPLLLTACGGASGVRPTPAPAPSPVPTDQTPPPAPAPVYHLASNPKTPTSEKSVAAAPSSKDITDNWWITAQAENLYETPKGKRLDGSGITVAIEDSGLDTSLPSTKYLHVIRKNCPACNDGSDVGSVDTGASDYIGHGTLVAQALAGAPWTRKSVGSGHMRGGFAPGVSLIVERITTDAGPDKGRADEDNMIEGARDAFDHGARIINTSYAEGTSIGSGLAGVSRSERKYYSSFLYDYRSMIQKGALFTWSAGNNKKKNPDRLAGMPTLMGDNSTGQAWLTVVALDPKTGRLASYSNACGSAAAYCLAAPGSNTLLIPHGHGRKGNTPAISYGTSFAAPMVAATAALVWQAYPWMTNQQIGQVLLGTATPMGSGHADATYGWGALNVDRAIRGPKILAWGIFDAHTDNHAYVFGNNMDGTGGIQKTGPGTLILTGNNTYSGPTKAVSGTLEIDGTVRSPVSVGTGATLSGTGVVQGNTTIDGTLLSGRTVKGIGDPDTGLSILGNAHFQKGSTLSVLIGSPLKATSATIDSRVSAVIEGTANGYTPQGTQTLLWTKNGLTGRFDSIAPAASVTLSATAYYTDTAANVVIKSMSVAKTVASAKSAGTVAVSDRALDVAGHVQNVLDAANPVAHQVLSSGKETAGQASLLYGAGAVQRAASVADLAKSIDSLAGDAHPTAITLTRQQAQAERKAYDNHLVDLFRGRQVGQQTNLGTLWVAYADGGARLNGANREASYSSHGLVGGLDVARAKGLTVGIGFAHSKQDAGIVGNAGTDRIEKNSLSVYAKYAPSDKWYVNGRLAGGRIKYDLTHTDWLGNTPQRAQANYNGHLWSLDIEAGRRFALGQNASFTPVAGVHADRLTTDSFTEKGVDAYAITAGEQHTTATSARLGARLSDQVFTGSWVWTFGAHAFWHHAFNGNDPALRVAYTGAPDDTFAIRGVASPDSWWNAGVRVQAASTRHWSFALGYDRASGGGLKGHSVQASVAYRF